MNEVPRLEKQHVFKKYTVRKNSSYTEHFTILEDNEDVHCSEKNNRKVRRESQSFSVKASGSTGHHFMQEIF